MNKTDKKHTVLVVDDNEDDYKIINRFISQTCQTLFCNEDCDVIKNAAEMKPECILLDYHLGADKGINILKSLKKNHETCNIPVIMLTGEKNHEIIIQCMKNKADDYLIKGDYDQERINLAIVQSIEKEHLKKKIREQQEQILQLSRIDTLTGVFNRRYLMERIEDEMLRGKRSKSSFSITLVDLDHFKSINDKFGHVKGDEVLKVMTEVIKSHIRNTDYVGRYGGDEFIIVLLDFDKKERMSTIKNHGRIINKIRHSLSVTPVQHSADGENNTNINFSATFGLALFDDSVLDFENIMNQADEALYVAKEDGKNCVAVYYGDQNVKILSRELD